MLLACPFCREMFQQGERKTCTVCGIKLVALEQLPKSIEADEEPKHADEEVLPYAFMGRGRGALLATAAVGIAVFFLPWIQQTLPERLDLSGPQLGRKLGWMWAPLVAWMVLFALVLSRRSVYRMRGARVATAFLSAMALLTAIVRASFLPTSTRIDPVELTLGPGLYLTAVLGVIGIALSFVFGGRIDDLPTQEVKRPSDEPLH